MKLLFWISVALALTSCSGKKKEAIQPVYNAPDVEWPEDEDLDDLPEAGEDDEES